MYGFESGLRLETKRRQVSMAVRRDLFLFSFISISLLCGCAKLRGCFAPDEKLPPKARSVTISWIAVDAPVAGYYVYRSSGSGKAVNLTSRAFYGTQFMDTAVEAGQTYSYYVTSVNYKGLESRPSETVSVTVPANVTPPAKN
jgi:hypothetical protein